MKNRVLFQIVLGVLCAHSLALIWSVYSPSKAPLYRPEKKLVVKTMQLSPKKQETVQTPASPAKAPAQAPKPKPKPKPKQVAKTKPKSKPKSKPKAEKKQPKKPKIDPTLLAKAKESFAKIQKSRDKRGAAGSKVPGTIEKLSSETAPDDSLYEAELIAKLRLMLKLPEYGAVTIKLTLDRSGKVQKVETVKAENTANRQYVEKTVPGLRFPSFGQHFGKASQYTFLITLKNE